MKIPSQMVREMTFVLDRMTAPEMAATTHAHLYKRTGILLQLSSRTCSPHVQKDISWPFRLDHTTASNLVPTGHLCASPSDMTPSFEARSIRHVVAHPTKLRPTTMPSPTATRSTIDPQITSTHGRQRRRFILSAGNAREPFSGTLLPISQCHPLAHVRH